MTRFWMTEEVAFEHMQQGYHVEIVTYLCFHGNNCPGALAHYSDVDYPIVTRCVEDVKQIISQHLRQFSPWHTAEYKVGFFTPDQYELSEERARKVLGNRRSVELEVFCYIPADRDDAWPGEMDCEMNRTWKLTSVDMLDRLLRRFKSNGREHYEFIYRTR